MISIIIPFYNEAENIPILLDEIQKKVHEEHEIILVDDGSDVSANIKQLTTNIVILHHKTRQGKGAALQTGIQKARGEIIIFMDGDLQDDPSDIAAFVQKMKEGFFVVNGVRTKRKDSFLVQLYSRVANWFLRTVLSSPFTDINCGFKALRKEVLAEIPLYANSFRFLPLEASYRGFKVTEIPVNNRERKYGISKFGSKKLIGGILDTITAFFLYQFAEKPLHFFGSIGGVLFLVGFIISLYLSIERIFFNVLLYRRPILQLGVVLIIVGIQILMTGLIGELIVYLNKKKEKM